MLYTIVASIISLVTALWVFTASGRANKDDLNYMLCEYVRDKCQGKSKEGALNQVHKARASMYVDKTLCGLIGGAVSVAILAIAPLMVFTTSYGNYIDAKAFNDATYAQYENAIAIYSEHAALDLKTAFTDSKHQGYQKNIADFIRDLRDNVVKYNKVVIGKEIWKQSKWFNWFIVDLDTGMKKITMK